MGEPGEQFRIAHIVNPLDARASSDLSRAQPVTFETMRAARRFAAGRVEVSFVSAQFADDRVAVPEDFVTTPDLERSVLDLGTFAVPRRLPLLRDILDRLYEATDADYLIYTNVDIAPMPHFYLAVADIVAEGFDAFTVDRRTIGGGERRLALMYADLGAPHPGHDCFVFARALYPSFYLADICIGSDYVGRTLHANLECWASSFRRFSDLHLTFHLGDELAWTAHDVRDYWAFNREERLKVYRHLHAAGRLPADVLRRAEERPL